MSTGYKNATGMPFQRIVLTPAFTAASDGNRRRAAPERDPHPTEHSRDLHQPFRTWSDRVPTAAFTACIRVLA